MTQLRPRPRARYTVWAFLAVAIFTAILPVTRALLHTEITYNEGWNVYNASAFAHHQTLYPPAYGWTTVNYPILSFAILAQLHRWTHDYLFTARILNLLATFACGLLCGLIVRRLTGSAPAALLAGAYAIAILCAAADLYIGQSDPQMLALAVFMAGLALYIARPNSLPALAAVAALFVLAGNIKHDPLAFPLAVALDLLLRSRKRLFWYCACGLLFAAITLFANLHAGGPGFLLQLAAPRAFSWAKGLAQTSETFGLLLLPFALAVYAAVRSIQDSRARVLSLLLAVGLVLGVVFSGGEGVAENAQFTAILATAMLSAIALHQLTHEQYPWATAKLQAIAPTLLLAWLIIPLIVCDTWNPIKRIRQSVASQQTFAQDVALLRTQPGPALCESLLRCYYAGKPFTYDPFNATRLIQFHKLNDAVIVDELRQHQFGAVQLDSPQGDAFPDRFDPTIAATIQQNYRPALIHSGATIYLPR